MEDAANGSAGREPVEGAATTDGREPVDDAAIDRAWLGVKHGPESGRNVWKLVAAAGG